MTQHFGLREDIPRGASAIETMLACSGCVLGENKCTLLYYVIIITMASYIIVIVAIVTSYFCCELKMWNTIMWFPHKSIRLIIWFSLVYWMNKSFHYFDVKPSLGTSLAPTLNRLTLFQWHLRLWVYLLCAMIKDCICYDNAFSTTISPVQASLPAAFTIVMSQWSLFWWRHKAVKIGARN